VFCKVKWWGASAALSCILEPLGADDCAGFFLVDTKHASAVRNPLVASIIHTSRIMGEKIRLSSLIFKRLFYSSQHCSRIAQRRHCGVKPPKQPAHGEWGFQSSPIGTASATLNFTPGLRETLTFQRSRLTSKFFVVGAGMLGNQVRRQPSSQSRKTEVTSTSQLPQISSTRAAARTLRHPRVSLKDEPSLFEQRLATAVKMLMNGWRHRPVHLRFFVSITWWSRNAK
jgi:hypothetical protein